MAIELDIKVGDVLLGGKYKNKRVVVKTIGKDALGQPTINGQTLLKMRIEKQLPPEKQSKETRDKAEEVVKEARLGHLDVLLEFLLCEDDSDVADKFARHVSRVDPGLADDLEQAASMAISAIRRDQSPKDTKPQLKKVFRDNPDINPDISGDTQGIKTFIDALADDREEAGKAKTFYTNSLKTFFRDR